MKKTNNIKMLSYTIEDLRKIMDERTTWNYDDDEGTG